MQEKRFFVAFKPVSLPGETSQEHDHSSSARNTSRSLNVTLSSVEEQRGWVRDLAQQEQRRMYLQTRMSYALSKTIRALSLHSSN
jgi:hypothetical protein